MKKYIVSLFLSTLFLTPAHQIFAVEAPQVTSNPSGDDPFVALLVLNSEIEKLIGLDKETINTNIKIIHNLPAERDSKKQSSVKNLKTIIDALHLFSLTNGSNTIKQFESGEHLIYGITGLCKENNQLVQGNYGFYRATEAITSNHLAAVENLLSVASALRCIATKLGTSSPYYTPTVTIYKSLSSVAKLKDAYRKNCTEIESLALADYINDKGWSWFHYLMHFKEYDIAQVLLQRGLIDIDTLLSTTKTTQRLGLPKHNNTSEGVNIYPEGTTPLDIIIRNDLDADRIKFVAPSILFKNPKKESFWYQSMYHRIQVLKRLKDDIRTAYIELCTLMYKKTIFNHIADGLDPIAKKEHIISPWVLKKQVFIITQLTSNFRARFNEILCYYNKPCDENGFNILHFVVLAGDIELFQLFVHRGKPSSTIEHLTNPSPETKDIECYTREGALSHTKAYKLVGEKFTPQDDCLPIASFIQYLLNNCAECFETNYQLELRSLCPLLANPTLSEKNISDLHSDSLTNEKLLIKSMESSVIAPYLKTRARITYQTDPLRDNDTQLKELLSRKQLDPLFNHISFSEIIDGKSDIREVTNLGSVIEWEYQFTISPHMLPVDTMVAASGAEDTTVSAAIGAGAAAGSCSSDLEDDKYAQNSDSEIAEYEYISDPELEI